MRILTVVLLLLFCMPKAEGQTFPVKWGELTELEKTMTTYDADSSAPALVIGDMVNAKLVETERGYRIIYYRHKRIKILKQEGLEFANIEIPFYSRKGLEKIKRLDAHTLNWENGELKEHVIPEKDIFDEKINNRWTNKKFTFPAAQIGSVIEYIYELESSAITTLNDYYFQGSLPRLWSEYKVAIPANFAYATISQGTDPYFIRECNDGRVEGKGMVQVAGIQCRWVRKDVEGMQAEAFITTMKDYKMRMQLQLAEYRIGNNPIVKVMTTWKGLIKDLLDDESFGNQFKYKRYFKKSYKAASKKASSIESPKERMLYLYDFVKQNITWNNYNGKFPSGNELDDAFDKKTGNVADINLTLLALLNAFDIEATPALLSTRSHGMVTDAYPILSQFNYVLVHVKIGEEEFLLDATDPNRPHYLLDIDCLTDKYFLLEGIAGEWRTIPKYKSISKQITGVQVSINKEGALEGGIRTNSSNYQALISRAFYKKEGKEKYLERSLKEGFPDMEILSSEFENIDDIQKPFKETVKFSISEIAEEDAEMIYLNPMLGQGWDKNPFRMEKRNYPVDIPYPFLEKYMFNFSIPEGYKVEELPKQIKYKLFEDAAYFEFLLTSTPHQIQIKSTLHVSRTSFSAKEYADVKAFFDVIVEKHASQIVLKKKE